MSLMSFDYFFKYNDNINQNTKFNKSDSFLYKYYALFGISVLSNAFISVFIYPFDTIKRRFQVNGGIGFSNQIMSFSSECNEIIRSPTSILNLYRYCNYLSNKY